MAISDAETASRSSSSMAAPFSDLNGTEVHTPILAAKPREVQHVSSLSTSKRTKNPASSSSLPDIHCILKRQASVVTPLETRGKAPKRFAAPSPAKLQACRERIDGDKSVPPPHSSVTKKDNISELQRPAPKDTTISEAKTAIHAVIKHSRDEITFDYTDLVSAETRAACKDDMRICGDKTPVIYASILDEEAFDPCKLETERCTRLHIEVIVNHRFVQGVGIEVLAQWGQEHSLPNSWEPETIMHADARELLLEYWDTTPGGRYKELCGTGHENNVFALHRYDTRPTETTECPAPMKKKIKLASKDRRSRKPPKAVLLVEVEYCGYRGTTWVPDELLTEDLPLLMSKYWSLAGGRPAES